MLRFLLIFLFGTCPIAVMAQTASFTVDRTVGCNPLTVHFTNTSAGDSALLWNFGNGAPNETSTTPSTSYTPVVSSVANYTVTLTAYYPGGDSAKSTTVITVYPNPTAGFYATDTAVCPYAPVNFVSTSSAGIYGPLTYNWTFGDGDTSASSAPAHSYPSPGYYPISLTVTNSMGCVSAHAYRSSYIYVYTPAAIGFYTSDTFFCKPLVTVDFTNTTTGTGPLLYSWSFGDGFTSTASAPAHLFLHQGGNTVSLAVTDADGCIDTLSRAGYINIGHLGAGFTYPASACLSSSDTFHNTSTPHVSSHWIFGDGGTSDLESPTHIFSTPGTFNVSLVVFDSVCYDTITQPINVLAPPTGTITQSTNALCRSGDPITFTGIVPSGCTVSWVFGDGHTGVGISTTRTFESVLPNGVIDNVTMIVTNSIGCLNVIQKFDTIFSMNEDISVPNPGGCLPYMVPFALQLSSRIYLAYIYHYLTADPGDFVNLPYPYPATSYSWNFGDRSPLDTSATPAHTYTATGTYPDIYCIFTTGNGCHDTDVYQNPITVGIPPVASFSVSPSHLCAGVNMIFTSTSTGIIDEYNWDFGDGGDAIDSVETYSYTMPGVFPVNLRAYDLGCPSALFIKNDTIDSPGSVINIVYNCNPRNIVTFSSGSYGATSLEWMLSDGSPPSTDSSFVHTFPSVSSYEVTLATYNARTGCRDTVLKRIALTAPSLFVYTTPGVNDTQICKDTRVDSIFSYFGGSGLGSDYVWYLNGSPVDSLVPTYISAFHVRGINTVLLVVTDENNCQDSASKQILVAKPIDSFGISPSIGCEPLTAHFTDYSTDVAGATVSHYFWSFGNGMASYTLGTHPIETYTVAGSYDVEEIVTDNLGCSDTLIFGSGVQVHKPVASFTMMSTTVCEGANIHFTSTSVGISHAWWNFGDGDTDSAISPNHIFTVTGHFIVKQVVYDSIGCISDTFSLPGYITVNPSPVSSFTMSDSFAVCPPLNIVFDNTSTGTSSSYHWYFGDGHTSVATNPTWFYDTAGYYTIELVSTNTFGCYDTAIGHASIFGYSGAFTYTPVHGCSPMTVNFNGRFAGSSVTSVEWDFGDGVTYYSTSLADTISHTYTVGAYMPKLFLSDTPGCPTTFSYGSDTIKADTLTPAFTTNPNPACQYSSLLFMDSSYSHFSPDTAWLWTYGTGATGSTGTPSYIYSVTGTYPVTLLVTDEYGCTKSVSQNVTVVQGPGPISGDLSVCAGSSTPLSDAVAGGVWSNSGSGIVTVGPSTGIVTGVAPGTAVITYQLLSTGCISTILITVNRVPSMIGGTPIMCIGLTASLSDSSAGGTWSSSNLSVAAVSTSSGLVTGLSEGTALITYSFGSGGSCGTAIPVTVTAIPSAITGGTTVCNGLTATLSDAVSGGVWTSSSTAISIGSVTGIVTGVVTGTARITYTIGTGCHALTTLSVLPLSPIAGATHICAGLGTALSDAVPFGDWSIGSTGVASINFSTGFVTSSSVGTAIITYSLPSGCEATATLTVNPEPAAISGNPHICRGAATAFSDTGSGAWSSTDLTVSVGSATGIVTGVSLGTGTVTYTLSTGCYAKIPVNITLPPSAITGTTTICAGSNTVLNDTSSGGVWSSGNTGIATIGSGTGTLTGVSAGTATISYTRGGCPATVTLSVNPLPGVINGSTGLCEGFSTTLSDTITGGSWSSGAPRIAGIAASGFLTGLTVGTAIITYMLPATGCFVTALISVGTLSPPITGDSSVCTGLTANVHDAAAGGTWSSSNTANAAVGSVSGIVTGISAGTATVSYVVSGCPVSKIFTVKPLPGPISGSFGCVGLTTALSDTSSGGTWSSRSTGIATVGLSTGIVTGVSAGTTIITYTLPTSCIATMTQMIRPVPNPVIGPVAVCAGNSALFSDTSPGGAWSSGSVSIATIGPGTGFATGLSAGIAMISYEIDECPAIKALTVNPLPAPVTGPDTMCEAGATVTEYDDTAHGLWSSTLVTVVDTTGVVTSFTAGVGIVSYTLGTGCLVTKSITVIPLPAGILGENYVCTDSTITLSDATGGGTWSSPAYGAFVTVGSFTGTVTGVSTGVAIISYKIPSGCLSTKTIAVNPSPAPIIGAPYVCAGSFTIFSDSTFGGYWSSDAAGIAAIGSATGVITGVSAGTAIISYAVTDRCGTSVVTATINVIALPVAGAIISDSIVCLGAHILLADTAGWPGTWSCSDTLAAVSGDTLSGLHPGATNVIYTVTNVCTTVTATKIVSIDSLPVVAAISGASEVCGQGELTLSDITPGGTWSSSDSSATVSAGIVTGEAAGVALISYSVTNYCGTSIVTHSITVDPFPVPGRITGDSILCNGYATVLSDTPAGGTWSSYDNSLASVTATGEVMPLAIGMDTVYYSLTNMCGTKKVKFLINIEASPNKARIITFPDSNLCTHTLYQNFGADTIPPPGVVYTWSADNNAGIYTAPGDMQYCLVNFNAPGICKIKLTAGIAGSECISADSIAYNVGPTVATDPVVDYYDPELVCTDNTADNYQWGYDDASTLDSTIFTGEVNQNYYNPNLDLANKYYWVLTYHNGCLQKSYYNPPLKVNFYVGNNNFTILLYPNPAENEINIAIKGANNTTGLEAKLFNVFGQAIGTTSIAGGTGNIPLTGCDPGVYMVMIIENGVNIGSGTFIKN